MPAFSLVGLPDAWLSELRDRVRAATANSGHPLPSRRITVNLSPAELPKAGTGFDLAIAGTLLSATGIAPAPNVRRFVHVGELGLDGRVRPVRGVLPAAIAAVEEGRPDLVVAFENVREAELIPGVRVWPVGSLDDLIVLHSGERCADEPPDRPVPGSAAVSPLLVPPDLADVIGQQQGRSALEPATAPRRNAPSTHPRSPTAS